MKTIPLTILAVLLPAAALAASFEGKVDFALTADRGRPQQLTYQMKGDKLRMEVPTPQGKGTMLVDPAKKEMLMLMDEQRMYMVMAMPDVQAQAEEKAADAKLEKTGQKEKIAGYEAEKYVVTQGGEQTELWLAEGLGTFMFGGGGNPMMGGRGGRGGAPAPKAWERVLAGKDLFPLRVVSHGKNGGETFKMEATSVQKQSLPDSLFTVPADYQKFDMGAMMRGMMPGR